MKDYVGQYRVTCEFAWDTLKPTNGDDPYIACRGEGKIYRWGDDILVYSVGKRKNKALFATLKDEGIELVGEALEGEFDTDFSFYERDLHKVAKIVGALTKGADIPPKSKRNLKLFGWYRNGEYKKYYKGAGLSRTK